MKRKQADNNAFQQKQTVKLLTVTFWCKRF